MESSMRESQFGLLRLFLQSFRYEVPCCCPHCAVNDVAAWILLALAIAMSGTGSSPLVSLWLYKGATLAAVLAAGLITDVIGIHALFGAFIVGVLIPKEGPFAGALVEKVEDLISGLFLPLYFVSSGLKTNVATIQGAQSWGLLVLVIFNACFGKIVGTVGVSMACKIPFSEALTLGFLMNTKGLVELIVLNIGKDRGVLNDQTFAIMVMMALFTTFITTPVVIAIYKPAKIAVTKYKHRRIQRDSPNAKLKMLTCFYGSKNIPSLINLVEASRGVEKKGGLTVYAMHLMELSERSSAIRMVHKARKNGLPFFNKGEDSDANQVVVAFETFQQLSKVSIEPTTAISALPTMHEDIISSAKSARAAIIVLPFHKHLRLDGHLETTRSEFRSVNRRVLEHAPCSVAILVDRGLGGSSHVSASNVDYTITVLFFGGHDDREALAYGTRMADHPGINLVVYRFLVDPEVAGKTVTLDVDDSSTPEAADEECLSQFKAKQEGNESIKYEEKIVKDASEITEVIKSQNLCNMFVIGRIPEGQLVAALNKKQECPELGPVGNLLTAPEFSTTASVLVVQQYRSKLSLTSLKSLKEGQDYTNETLLSMAINVIICCLIQYSNVK
ncbi:hypothetical protein Leryth_017007 [Lithospermum erythrorhizon]|nr:hypothetical protein Leryth_017007 [Lithospermum erythrorhizon]